MTLDQLFYDKIKKTDTCWLWIGYKTNGYGRFWFNNRLIRAHRFSYEVVYGVIPLGKDVCHKCDNPACVNPEHLFLGTHTDNMRDMRKKGRGVSPDIAGEKHHFSKLTLLEVSKIRELYSSQKVTQKTLSAQFNVTISTISKIVNKKLWK